MPEGARGITPLHGEQCELLRSEIVVLAHGDQTTAGDAVRL
jgi:hypothetical protein